MVECVQFFTATLGNASMHYSSPSSHAGPHYVDHTVKAFQEKSFTQYALLGHFVVIFNTN